MMDRFRQETGVAMIVVLFVGATLAVLTTSAAFMSVRGLRSAQQDKSSVQALAAAEAGLERMLLDVVRGDVGYGSMRTAGCSTPPVSLPPGALGPGTYDVQLTIYEPSQNPKVPQTAPWSAANAGAAPCLNRTSNLFAITATGNQASGTRVVRQIVSVKVGSTKLPLGIYADKIDANGNPAMNNISVFTAGDIIGRGKFAMKGSDAYFKMKDVYNQSAFPTFTWTGGYSWDSFIPASVHATGEIYAKNAATRGREHPPSPNCAANDTRNGGVATQSEWDGSACSGCANSGAITVDCGPTGYPPTARFTSADLARIAQVRNFTEAEYASLKSMAQTSGIYCQFSISKCWKNGVEGPAQTTWQTADLPTGNPQFVAYFEFPYSTNTTANRISWRATWKAISGVMCNAANPLDNRSAVIVVRNGSFDFGGNTQLTGAVMVPEGDFDSSGTPLLHGSVTARTFRVRGTADFESSACFAGTLPTMLAEVTALGWSEIDR